MQRHDRNRENRAEQHSLGRVEDYTTPFLITAGALLFVVLFALWAFYGLLATIFIAWLVDRFFLNR